MVMNISQSYTGTYSHNPNYLGNPKDYPIDEPCKDTGRNYIYCPCSQMEVKKIYGVGTTGTNTIWLRSTSPVDMPCGTDYLVMMVIHPEDDDLSKIAVGTIFKKGEPMFREGANGISSGNHFHISVGKGDIIGTGWIKNDKNGWVITTTGGAIKPEQAFYLDSVFTNFVNSQDITFTSI